MLRTSVLIKCCFRTDSVFPMQYQSQNYLKSHYILIIPSSGLKSNDNKSGISKLYSTPTFPATKTKKPPSGVTSFGNRFKTCTTKSCARSIEPVKITIYMAYPFVKPSYFESVIFPAVSPTQI